MQVAFYWIEEADEEVVYLIPDGITNVTKSERTGCYPDAFARVSGRTRKQWDADLERSESRNLGMMRRQQRTLSTNRRRTKLAERHRSTRRLRRCNAQRNRQSVTPRLYAEPDDAEIQSLIADS